MPQNIAPPGLISLLAAALAQQPTKPLVLALDGRCGSGKPPLQIAGPAVPGQHHPAHR